MPFIKKKGPEILGEKSESRTGEGKNTRGA